MSYRFAVLPLVAAVLLAPHVVGVESVSIPMPTEGSEATYLQTSMASSDEFTLRWDGPVDDVADGFGAVHRAYPVSKSPACFSWHCDRVTWHDVATRAVVNYNESTVFEDEETTTTVGPATLSERHISAHKKTEYFASIDVFHALQGRTLEAGETLTIPGPPTPGNPAGAALTFRAIGWETVEAASLFRIEVERGAFDQVLWFDGVAAVPMRSEWAFFFGTTVHTLTAWTPGGGATLHEPAYSPRVLVERSGVQRTVIGVDGPTEPMSQLAPLQQATAAFRVDPRAIVWFAGHPGAYLVHASFDENPEQGTVHWFLIYEGPTGEIQAQLQAPIVPEGVPVPFVVTTVSDVDGPPSRPPASQIVGRSLACYGEALAIAGSGNPSEPEGGWSHSGQYSVNSPASPADINCLAMLGPPQSGTVLLGQFAVPAFDIMRYQAAVHGTTGGIGYVLESRWAHGTDVVSS